MLVKAAIFQPTFSLVLWTTSHRTDQETLDPAAWEQKSAKGAGEIIRLTVHMHMCGPVLMQ